jgi:hypothetical protein
MKEQEAVDRLRELARVIQEARDHRIGVNQFDAEAITTVLDALDKANARLWGDVCNSGHKTLPLTLWNCPRCEEIKREGLEEKLRIVHKHFYVSEQDIENMQEIQAARSTTSS